MSNRQSVEVMSAVLSAVESPTSRLKILAMLYGVHVSSIQRGLKKLGKSRAVGRPAKTKELK